MRKVSLFLIIIATNQTLAFANNDVHPATSCNTQATFNHDNYATKPEYYWKGAVHSDLADSDDYAHD